MMSRISSSEWVAARKAAAVRQVDAVIVGIQDRREASRKWTSRAPASRIMRTIFFDVVPRTSESSIRMIPLAFDRGAVGRMLHAHASSRTLCVGWMKVRPT